MTNDNQQGDDNNQGNSGNSDSEEVANSDNVVWSQHPRLVTNNEDLGKIENKNKK